MTSSKAVALRPSDGALGTIGGFTPRFTGVERWNKCDEVVAYDLRYGLCGPYWWSCIIGSSIGRVVSCDLELLRSRRVLWVGVLPLQAVRHRLVPLRNIITVPLPPY